MLDLPKRQMQRANYQLMSFCTLGPREPLIGDVDVSVEFWLEMLLGIIGSPLGVKGSNFIEVGGKLGRKVEGHIRNCWSR